MNLIKCSECKKVFSTRYNLRKHIRKFHAEKADILAPKKTFNFQCDQCKRNFTHLRHLRYHKKKHESVPPLPRKNKKCPLCDFWGQQRKELLNHFSQEHGVEIQTSTHSFVSIEDFKLWKVKVENQTKAHFIKSRGVTVIKMRQITHYGCHRSGIFISKSKGLRHLKNQGSNKINGFCPAAIKLISCKNGECQVTFYETHIGHDNDLNHLWLNPTDKEIIAAKITENVPFTEILYEVKNLENSHNPSERIQLLTRKDLHNIKQTLEHRRTRALKSPQEELVMDCSNDSFTESDILQKVVKKTRQTPSLDAGKEDLKASIEKIIDRISNFEELGAFRKLVAEMSSVLNSGKSEEIEKNTETTTQKSPRLLLIAKSNGAKHAQALHYGDHDYAHPVNSVYQIQYEIND